ncbi:hypothetical protein [Nocardiopsis oceani]
MKTMMPRLTATQTPTDLDVAALAHVIDNTHDHELFAEVLPDESAPELAARQAAAADILDSLLGEIAGWSE